MKNRAWITLFLLLIWCGFSNRFDPFTVVLGFVFAVIIHFLVYPKEMTIQINLWGLVILCSYIIWELVRSSIEVAGDVIAPTPKNQPDFIELPLACENTMQITVLSNLISLTPGTLAVDVEAETNRLILHVMFMQNEDKIIHFIKNRLEPMIIRAIKHE